MSDDHSDVTLKVVFAFVLLVSALLGSGLPVLMAHRRHRSQSRDVPAAGLAPDGSSRCEVSVSRDATDNPQGHQESDCTLAVNTVDGTEGGHELLPTDGESAISQGKGATIVEIAAEVTSVPCQCPGQDEVLGASCPKSQKHDHSKTREYNWFAIGESFSGGIVLSAGLMHLLADGTELVQEAQVTPGWPLSYFLAGLVALVLFVIDTLLEQAVSQDELLEDLHLTHVLTHSHTHVKGEEHHHHSMSVDLDASDRETKNRCLSRIKKTMWIMFVVLSMHAFLEGLALGAAANESTITAVFIAIASHKVFEGFALGVRLHAVIALSRELVVLSWALAVMFSVVSPLGIGIGIVISDSLAGAAAEIASGVLLSLAAGSFLYVGLVEIIPSAIPRGSVLLNCTSLIAGYGAMSALALWSHEGHSH
eukprot:ANDGO_02236.mRNA.1 Protein zntC